MTYSIEELARTAVDRESFWLPFIQQAGVRSMAEIGVYRGAFAERVLQECSRLERYVMIDPWRHLEDWGKPANKSDEKFQRIYERAMSRTAEHADKRVVLRGTTLEVIDRVPDGSLDLAYIDGDHTLRGVTVDLHSVLPKVRDGGWIAGDDFCSSIFQHSLQHEPTMVFPYAVYFAEAVGLTIYGLPHDQFLMQRSRGGAHAFVDLTGAYSVTTVKGQLDRMPAADTVSPKPTPPASGLGRLRRAARVLLEG